MTRPTLLILAAGMGSRYGGIKQIDQFGPGGETIVDYSLYDAIRAGFGKVVFVIRKELKADFEAIYESKLKGKIDYEFVFQELDYFVPHGTDVSMRAKPWGTAHAILCAKEVIHEPFAAINADDFYGAHAFRVLADFLSIPAEGTLHSLVGYRIENTLSDNGSVSRGVCSEDGNGFLASVVERTKVERKDGKIVFFEGDEQGEIKEGTLVSMNFWGFQASVFEKAKTLFEAFVKQNVDNPKAEFFIPLLASDLIQKKEGAFKVLTSDALWFGVTYKEDKPTVKLAISEQIAKGNYPEKLWE